MQLEVAYYDNKRGMGRTTDSSLGHNNFNGKNNLSVGTEVLGKVRAHLLTIGYIKFYFLKLKYINISPNILKHTLFLSLLSTFLQQILLR